MRKMKLPVDGVFHLKCPVSLFSVPPSLSFSLEHLILREASCQVW